MEISVLIAAMAVAAGIQAAELPMVKPEVVGFSSERLQKIREFTQRRVDEDQVACAIDVTTDEDPWSDARSWDTRN